MSEGTVPVPRRDAITLSPIEAPKASDVLAEQLRERILSGQVPEGTVLPPERELVAQTRMSRTTVREALRILEVQGLVKIKAGRAGGAFVTSPGEESVASSIGLVIRGQRIRLATLLETREAIEPICASLAAKNRTEEEIAALESIDDATEKALDNRAAFLKLNIDWHVGVAVAGHNEILTGLMRALSQAIYTSTEHPEFISGEVRHGTAAIHRRITQAIRSQDADAAGRRMSRHIHTYSEKLADVDTEIDTATS